MKKSISTLFLSTALAFTALCAMTAYAGHHGGVETERHKMKADANGDGKVSYEEFKAARLKHMEEHFARRDANNDGFIDAGEKKAAMEKFKARKKACKLRKSGEKH